MQFAYFVNKLDFRASKDYDGNKVDLPSTSFATATMNIWVQKSPWSPRKKKADKTQKLRQHDGKTGDYIYG